MFQNMKRLPMMLLVLILMLTVEPIDALAAALTSPYTNLSASFDGSGDASASTGKVSITVNGAKLSDKNGTLTLTNSGSEAAQLSFSYVASGTYSSFTVAGSSASESGSYSAEIAAGASIKIYLSVSKSGILSSAKSATVSLTNVKLEVASAANVTVSHNGLGTTSVGDNTVASGTTVEVDAVGATFVASPVSGASFVGWINTADNSVVSTAASFTYVPTGDISLKAIFARPTMEACFWGSAKACLFESLSAAITHASNASNKTITLAASGTLSSGSYTIPSGVTLLAPFDANGTLYTTSPGYVKDSYTTPSAYSTLTMAAGANITVASGGAISVSAKVSAKMGYAGAPTSKYGHIDMNAGSSITVNSGGNLYAWGYITGSGSVTIKSGASVYESFQVVDWRGGTASSGMLGNSNKVFPMTQYYVQNVEAPMTYESGASEICSMIADIVSVRQVTVSFLGTSGCMFNLTSGSATKRYDGSTDRLVIDFNGEMAVSPTEIELVKVLYSIDLEDYVLPINGNITINVNNGAILTFNQTTSLLSGAQLNIAEGGTVKLGSGKQLYVYDETEWKSGYYVYSSAYFRPVRYAHSKTYTRTNTDIIDAKILVNGTLDASAGYLYTTSSGANICSTANGVVKVQAAESSPTLYGATQSGTTITYASISIVPAWLKNEDATYIETSANTYYYDHHDCEHGDDATHGVWHPGEHTVTSVVTAPTCTEAGYTTYTCACDHSYTTDEVAAAGHKWSGGSCTVCGATRPAVAQIGTTLYYTLADAVEAYNTDSGYIQMLLDSSDETTISKTVYLDLNGCDVSGVTLSGTLYGADSKTDGYESGKEGSITVSISGGTVAAAVNNVNGKDYVAHYDSAGGTYSFHRFAITPVACRFYLNSTTKPTHSHLAFKAALQGDDIAIGEIDNLGFVVNGTEFWYSGSLDYSKLEADEDFPAYKTVSFVAVDYDGTSNFDTVYTITAQAAFDEARSADATISSDETPAVSMTSALEQAGIAIG